MITRQAFCSELTIQPSGCRARLRIDGGEEFELAFKPGESYTVTFKPFSFDDLDPPRQAPPRP
jgi:hypothetical protein